MQWSEVFNAGQEPSEKEIRDFVANPLWDDLADHLRQVYNVQPKLFYSGCLMENGVWKGWNVKYKKRGKSLCTLYPKQGYFVALIQTKIGDNSKPVALEVTSESILGDVKGLVALRNPSLRA